MAASIQTYTAGEYAKKNKTKTTSQADAQKNWKKPREGAIAKPVKKQPKEIVAKP